MTRPSQQELETIFGALAKSVEDEPKTMHALIAGVLHAATLELSQKILGNQIEHTVDIDNQTPGGIPRTVLIKTKYATYSVTVDYVLTEEAKDGTVQGAG